MHLACIQGDGLAVGMGYRLQMWLGFEFCHQKHCCKLQNFESIKFNKYLQYPEARPQKFDRVYIASFQIHTISIFWYFILFHSHCRGHTPCKSMQDTIGSDRLTWIANVCLRRDTSQSWLKKRPRLRMVIVSLGHKGSEGCLLMSFVWYI